MKIIFFKEFFQFPTFSLRINTQIDCHVPAVCRQAQTRRHDYGGKSNREYCFNVGKQNSRLELE